LPELPQITTPPRTSGIEGDSVAQIVVFGDW
jgi:hypothetical protein